MDRISPEPDEELGVRVPGAIFVSYLSRHPWPFAQETPTLLAALGYLLVWGLRPLFQTPGSLASLHNFLSAHPFT